MAVFSPPLLTYKSQEVLDGRGSTKVADKTILEREVGGEGTL